MRLLSSSPGAVPRCAWYDQPTCRVFSPSSRCSFGEAAYAFRTGGAPRGGTSLAGTASPHNRVASPVPARGSSQGPHRRRHRRRHSHSPRDGLCTDRPAPPVVGLYASTVPLVAYAILGRSRKLGVGPLATISIMAAAGLSKLAAPDTSRFVAYAATVAVIVGAIHVVLGVGRLGFVVRFLSEPVMTGFLAGVGMIIVATQLGPLFGFQVSGQQ